MIFLYLRARLISECLTWHTRDWGEKAALIGLDTKSGERARLISEYLTWHTRDWVWGEKAALIGLETKSGEIIMYGPKWKKVKM